MKQAFRLVIALIAASSFAAGSAQVAYYGKPSGESSSRFWLDDFGKYTFGWTPYDQYVPVNVYKDGQIIHSNFQAMSQSADGFISGFVMQNTGSGEKQVGAYIDQQGDLHLLDGIGSSEVLGMSGDYMIANYLDGGAPKQGLFENGTLIKGTNEWFGIDLNQQGWYGSRFGQFSIGEPTIAAVYGPDGTVRNLYTEIPQAGYDTRVFDLADNNLALFSQTVSLNEGTAATVFKTYDPVTRQIMALPTAPVTPYVASGGGSSVSYHPRALWAEMNKSGQVAVAFGSTFGPESYSIWSYTDADGWLNMGEEFGLIDIGMLTGLGITEEGTIYGSMIWGGEDRQYNGGFAMNRYAPVPEPSSMILLALGAGGFIAARRRKSRA